MNIPEEDRPIASLKVNIKKHRNSVKEIAAWLHKQADYLVEHQTEVSEHFMARLFFDRRPKKK